MFRSVPSIIATRFFQGTAACIEGPIAAGVIADLFRKEVRGPAMAVGCSPSHDSGSELIDSKLQTFVLTIFTANATGPVCANWIAQKLNWHWVVRRLLALCQLFRTQIDDQNCLDSTGYR